ncbi:hypothetical protein [Bizionia myxarmorum]|uniref:Uncharacterized protein n=1 Tax=Bizionia myxarmorum TaxID=291186 RepID=A0A5D0RB52_9FLAO|nr:hypothetical protein [Bizionia myxarmorum]TYB78603.1 hypothetical protein ES674_02150 [Bizionia myxarmorum]
MPDLVIKYKKKKQNIQLALGLMWIALGVIGFFLSSENLQWHNVFIVVLGAIQIGMAFWNMKYHYITITNDWIKENSIFSKKILRKNIIEIKKFAGDYTFKTHDKNLVINSNLVDENSLVELDAFIETMELPEQNANL